MHIHSSYLANQSAYHQSYASRNSCASKNQLHGPESNNTSTAIAKNLVTDIGYIHGHSTHEIDISPVILRIYRNSKRAPFYIICSETIWYIYVRPKADC